jgi:hypothetical protein
VPADTATLLVPGQIVAVDLRLDRINGRNQLRRYFRAEELREIEKGALPYELAPELIGVLNGVRL